MRRLLAVLLLLAGGVAFADDIPATQQSYLIIRILAYDRNVRDRSGGSQVNVVVVYKAGLSASEAVQGNVVGALQTAAGTANVGGLPVNVFAVPYDATLEGKVTAAHAAAVYICPGLESEVATIQAMTRKDRVLSFTDVEPNVKGGLSVGLVLRDGKPKILVNLSAAQAEGADLDSALLRVSEVIK
jgi:hypothetical protein